MCLILFSKPKDGNYKFVLTSNRDEFYERKTKNMFWWNETKGLLAGQDLEQKGTWLGISKQGKFAAVTNVREFYKLRENQNFLSRGDLVKDFFESDESPTEYISKIETENYLGFNLIVSDMDDFSIISSQGTEHLDPELVVIGNRALNTETEKLKNAKEDFKKILKSNFCHKDLIYLMQSPKKKYDFNLDEINKNHGKEFNSRFITSEIYGTRSTTVITISKDDQVKVTEVVYDKTANELETNSFKFKIFN